MYLGVNPPTNDVFENMSFEKLGPRGFVFVCDRDSLRQPVRMRCHPARFAGRETRIALLRARKGDAVLLEGLFLPVATVYLVHADWRAMLFRNLRQRSIAFYQQQIARLLGGVLINAYAAAAHFQHHRQQVDFEPIGAADILLVQDRVELLEQQQRIKRVGLGVWADIARRQPPDVLLKIDPLAPFGEARGLDSL